MAGKYAPLWAALKVKGIVTVRVNEHRVKILKRQIIKVKYRDRAFRISNSDDVRLVISKPVSDPRDPAFVHITFALEYKVQLTELDLERLTNNAISEGFTGESAGAKSIFDL